MTLIIGIKCRDGIVLGSDGAATFGSLSQPTIRQNATKLSIIDGCVIVGTSGHVGLGQRIKALVETMWMENSTIRAQALAYQKTADVMLKLRTGFLPVVGPEFQAAQLAQPLLGNAVLSTVLTSTLVALPVQDKPCLLQFDHQGAPEEATSDLPFVSIGSGQAIADPFLAFLRRIFWSQELPLLEEGIFATLWTLEHAIQTHPGGVSDPKQIVILTQSSQKRFKWEARQLNEKEFQPHIEAIAAYEENLRKFRDSLQAGGSSAITTPPSLSS